MLSILFYSRDSSSFLAPLPWGGAGGGSPQAIGIATQMGVVISVVASHFISDEIGLLIGLVSRLQFYLGNDQTIVIAVKLVDLEGVIAAVDQIAGLVDDAWLAEHQQMFGLIPVDGSLKLIAAQTAVERRTFNGEESLVIAKAHPHSPSVPAADIPLADMTAAACLLLERAVPDQELPLDFHSAHRPCR